jgi:hypothetical protein
MEFKTEAEVSYWMGLCSENDLALNKALQPSDLAILSREFEHTSPIAQISGNKRRRIVTILDEPPASAKRRQLETTLKTATLEGNEYQVNTAYEYEGEDVTRALHACLNEINNQVDGIPIIAWNGVNAITADSLKNALLEEREIADKKEGSKARIVLIPCNIGDYHWVGLSIKFNEAGHCEKAEFINSTRGNVPITLNIQLAEVYPDQSFTERFDLYQQADGTSCGAYTVENLILNTLGATSSPEEDIALIRARQLHLIKQQMTNPDIPKDKKCLAADYENFYQRQLNNIPSYHSASAGTYGMATAIFTARPQPITTKRVLQFD